MENLIFIILRHINSEKSNRYWKESYECVRQFYPDTKIIIIDDNSSYKKDDDYKLVNCDIIQSEFPQRGELLPYYYFHKLKPAKKAVIIHDSVFINDQLDIDDINTYKFLWEFEHNWDNDKDTVITLGKCKKSLDLVNFYCNKKQWKGCFGGMSIITWDFLDRIDKEFDFFNIMLKEIDSRVKRMCFERIIACVCTYLDSYNSPLFCNIHQFANLITNGRKGFFIRYEDYNQNNDHYKRFPIMKIWSDR